MMNRLILAGLLASWGLYDNPMEALSGLLVIGFSVGAKRVDVSRAAMIFRCRSTAPCPLSTSARARSRDCLARDDFDEFRARESVFEIDGGTIASNWPLDMMALGI